MAEILFHSSQSVLQDILWHPNQSRMYSEANSFSVTPDEKEEMRMGYVL